MHTRSLTICLEIEEAGRAKHRAKPRFFSQGVSGNLAFLQEVGLAVGNVRAPSASAGRCTQRGLLAPALFLWYLNPVGHISWLKEKPTKPCE